MANEAEVFLVQVLRSFYGEQPWPHREEFLRDLRYCRDRRVSAATPPRYDVPRTGPTCGGPLTNPHIAYVPLFWGRHD